MFLLDHLLALTVVLVVAGVWVFLAAVCRAASEFDRRAAEQWRRDLEERA